jgi:hypothetical protein
MSWWKKLFGSSTVQRTTQLRFPVVVEIIPGALSASVHSHKVFGVHGDVPCWSYVSRGLRAREHDEVVFTMRREVDEPEDQFPDEPLQLFALFHRVAGEGQRVGPGGITEFGSRRFFGHHLVYVRARPLDGVTLPPSCLAALPVNDEELRAVRMFGLTRVLARMGEAAKHYPYPPWIERRRSGLPFARVCEESLLAKLPRSSFSVRVVMSNNRVTAMVLRSAQPQLRQTVVADHPFALLTDLDETADSCLVWQPGQHGPCAIAPPRSTGARTSGCFLAFLPEQPDNGAILVEDGFVLQLTTASWATLLRALADGTDLSLPTSNAGMSFALRWVEEQYVSPIDGAVYHAEGGWQTYQPTGGSASDGLEGAAAGDGIRLLTAQADIAARCSVRDLATFCEAAEICMKRALAQHNGLTKLVVRMTCTPSGHRVDLSPQGQPHGQPHGQPPRQVVQELRDALDALAKLPVREGDVVFEIGLTATPSA